MMKMKHLLLLLALGGFGASCSNDDLTDGSTNPIEGRTELQIAFSGTGENQEYTRAIASEGENKIDKLAVYLFAAVSQTGPYYYMETWEEGTAFDSTKPDDLNFKKQASGTGWKATILPRELKGLPWIKLMCVANNGTPVGGTTDGKFYDEDGAEILTTLTPVTTDADGKITNAGAATNEVDFRKAYTAALGAGIIKTPLLMTGEGTTKISGSVSKVDINLKRAMARFDIDNNSKTSSLTIEEVSLAHGRKAAHLWGAEMSVVDKADLDKPDGYLATYQPVKFSDMEGANDGMLESAYYVYPGLATDESYLIIKGKYKSPVNGQPVAVTYNVPIVRTAEGALKGEYIPLKANSRYKLRITDVSQSNVFGSFEVVDWTSGGGITIRPDNDAPVFDAAKVFEGSTNVPKALTGPTVLPNAFEVVGETGTFNVTIAATGKVRCEKDQATVRAIGNDWLSISELKTEESDGVWNTTFKVDYTNAVGQQPIAVHFINETASFDPALWTTLNFYGPKAKPSFAVLTTGGTSKGNTATVGTDGAPAATLYTLDGSFVMFDITCLEGLVVDATGATGYTTTEEKVEGSVHTCKIAVTDAATANGGTIIFKNAGDEEKTTELTLTVAGPAIMTAEEVTDAGNVGSGIETGTLKIDLDVLTSASASYTFRVKAPEGVTAPANLADCPWLTIDETTPWNDTDGFAVYTVTSKVNPENTDDFDLVFKNALTEDGITAEDLTITLNKDYSKPKFSVTTNADNGLNEAIIVAKGALSATGKMYNTNYSKNQLQVDVNCPEDITVTSTGGLTATKGTGNTYTITTDGTTTAAGATATVTFANKNDVNKNAVLTVTMVDPSITATSKGTYLELKDFIATVDVAGADGNYTVDCGVIEIFAPTGSTVAGDTPASDWVIFAPATGAGTPTVDHATAVTWKVSLKTAGDRGSSAYADYRIVIHNAATDTDEYITIKKKP